MLYDGDTFERNGRTFRVTMLDDNSGRSPWEDDDGTGIVSDWTRRDKEPGERVLSTSNGSKRFYDVARTMQKAKKEGWGLCDADKAKLAERLGRAPTRKQVIMEAVERDYERLRRWCNDQWSYIGVVVQALDGDGEPLGETESLWGIESDCSDYIKEVANELADEIGSQMDRALAVAIAADRPDLAPNH